MKMCTCSYYCVPLPMGPGAISKSIYWQNFYHSCCEITRYNQLISSDQLRCSALTDQQSTEQLRGSSKKRKNLKVVFNLFLKQKAVDCTFSQ